MASTLRETLDIHIKELREHIQSVRAAQERSVDDFTGELAETADIAVSTITRLLYVPKANLTIKTLGKIDRALREMEGVDYKQLDKTTT